MMIVPSASLLSHRPSARSRSFRRKSSPKEVPPELKSPLDKEFSMIDEERADGPSVGEEGVETTAALVGTSTSMVRLPPLRLEQIERVELTPPHRTPPKPPSVLPLPVPVPQAPSVYALSIEPTRAAFTTVGGLSKHLLMNHSGDRLAIKVKCSNNEFFRVNPVYSFLDSGALGEIEFIRLQGGGPKKDIIQLIYVVCRDHDSDATTLFGSRAKVRSVIVPVATI